MKKQTKDTDRPDRRRIWCLLGYREEKCNLGENHTLKVWGFKDVRLFDHYEFNNGYQTLRCGVYEDRKGNRYYEQISIDYSNNISYYDKSRKLLWWPSPNRNGGINVDLTGKVLERGY